MTSSDGDRLQVLPPLREVIAKHQLSAKRALGQNFLLDLNLTGRIARTGGPLAGEHIIEVGPGPGGLTRALLAEGAGHVTVIERDHRVLPALAEIAAAAPGRLTIIEGDALAIDYTALAGTGGARIVANLPYNIATPLLTSWLAAEPWPAWWKSLTLMFQREVAERIVAGCGDKAYGRLAVLTSWRASAQIAFDVPPRAFTPPPKVVSSIVRLDPKPDAESVSPAAVSAVTAAAFGQRRKMLRSSLKSLWPQSEAVLAEVGIDPSLRAEQIAVDDFLALAAHLEQSRVTNAFNTSPTR